MSDIQDLNELAESALQDGSVFNQLVDELSGPSRRNRQNAASTLAIIAKKDPEAVKPATDALIDALNRPEAQTRWEVLDALTEIVELDARSCDKALSGAEASLFNEDNGVVQLSAMRFLCKYGSTTENRSNKTWPLIDEAIQCYHGDTGFQEMLIAVIDYSQGKLAQEVKDQLKDRMAFDAANGRGALRNRAKQIIENLS